MIPFRDIRDVRRLGETPEAYLVSVEIDIGDGYRRTEYPARAGGGGICDDILAAIASGAFTGEITDYVPPPPPAPHELPLTQSQWIWALDAHDLYDPIDAAIRAQPAAVRATLRAKAFHKPAYHYADVLALLSEHADIMPAEAVALTEADIQAIWAAARDALE